MKNKLMNKYVTFQLGETMFAVEVLKTREIVEYGRITPVPEAPEFIEGVINLRGSVVPVVDLTMKFFKRKSTIDENTSIMIAEPHIDSKQALMGLIVDTVKDVIEVKDEQLEPPPRYGSQLKAEYLLNVISQKDHFIMILDIDKVLSAINIEEGQLESMRVASAGEEKQQAGD
ncbi:MAG: chemotaxis protein CheW [Spirochaetes bacterium]|nr:chemotaxis protein CheW [Spirochaetota bacterium]